MLRRARGELIRLAKQTLDEIGRRPRLASFAEHAACGADHLVLAPLLLGGVHGFGDAVGVGQQHIAGFELEGALLEARVLKQTDHHARRRKRQDRIAAQNDRRVVTGVDIGQRARGGLELREEERRIAI